MNTIQEAKQFLRENMVKGTRCPVCGQIVKLYPYKLNSSSARCLIILYKLDRANPNEWVHIQREFANRKLNANSMDYIFLKHWGLIEPKPGNDDPTKKANGYFRITEKGREFAEGKIELPSHVFVYLNKARRFSETKIDIKKALSIKFDYQELMGGAEIK